MDDSWQKGGGWGLRGHRRLGRAGSPVQFRGELRRDLPPLLWGKTFGCPPDLIITKTTQLCLFVDVKNNCSHIKASPSELVPSPWPQRWAMSVSQECKTKARQ